MLERRSQAKVRTAVALLLGALFLGGCDRGAAPVDVPQPAERLPDSRASAETPVASGAPHGEGPSASEPLLAKAPPAAKVALEPSLAPPRFDDAAPPEFRRSFASFQGWVHAKGGEVHAALVDLETDRWLLRAKEQTPINVASNAKIVTAAAALELLGPAFTFRTELFGNLDERGRASRLTLKGGGAPDFSDADLWRLVRVARGMGLSEVGDIVVDQSRFSERYVPPCYEQQPNEWAPFRANVSALSINQNAVDLNVLATVAGAPAKVWYSPPGVVDPVGKLMTGQKGSGDKVRWSLDVSADETFPVSKVGGTLAEGLGRRRYARRLEDPRRAGGLVLRALLLDDQIPVKGQVTLGQVGRETRLALWDSAPLAELLRALGKDSDNFYAEMIFHALSSAEHRDSENAPHALEPWSSERAAGVVRSYLKERGISLKGVVIKNGSGLFDGNRYSAELLVQVLAAMEDNPRIYQDFVSHLAMGGTDGTLEKRMKSSDLAARIRAKTGTLRSFIALSGYIQRTRGRSPAAFSVIVSGIGGQHGALRSRIDALVLDWARTLEESGRVADGSGRR